MELKKQAMSTGSSGSDGSLLTGMVDERKRRRMISNQESARRSRIKKLKQMDDLIAQVMKLKSENDQMIRRITATEQSYMYVAAERDIVQAEAMALTNRLQNLNEVIYVVEQVNHMSINVPETGYLNEVIYVVEPWQLPYQAPQFSVSANMFQC